MAAVDFFRKSFFLCNEEGRIEYFLVFSYELNETLRCDDSEDADHEFATVPAPKLDFCF